MPAPTFDLLVSGTAPNQYATEDGLEARLNAALEALWGKIHSTGARGWVVPLSTVSGGNTIVATFSAEFADMNVINGQLYVLEQTWTNTGPVTLAVDGAPPLPVRDHLGNELLRGEMVAGARYIIRKSASAYEIVNAHSWREIEAPIIRAEARVSTIALLAAERAAVLEASLEVVRGVADAALARVAALEKDTTSKEVQVSVYPIAKTVGTTAAIAVAAGPVQRLQLQNKSETQRVGVSFGFAPTSVNGPGVFVLDPGGAIDTSLITGTPIYAISDGGTADIAGAFSVPLNAPNPNWEADFQSFIGRFSTPPSFEWTAAYRDLYSAWRGAGLFDKALGLFMLGGHAGQAGRCNWVSGQVATVVGGAPFSTGQGFALNGTSQYLETGLVMGGASADNPFTRSTDVTLIAWPDATDQDTGAAALGDNVCNIQPNTTPGTGAVRTAATQGDPVPIPYLGAMLGMTRVNPDQAIAHTSGGGGAIIHRTAITGYTERPMLIGANNTSSGPAGFYKGTIKAVYFGKALSAVQVLAADAALERFKAATAGLA